MAHARSLSQENLMAPILLRAFISTGMHGIGRRLSSCSRMGRTRGQGFHRRLQIKSRIKNVAAQKEGADHSASMRSSIMDLPLSGNRDCLDQVRVIAVGRPAN